MTERPSASTNQRWRTPVRCRARHAGGPAPGITMALGFVASPFSDNPPLIASPRRHHVRSQRRGRLGRGESRCGALRPTRYRECVSNSLDTMSRLSCIFGMGRSSAKGRRNAVRQARRAADLTQAELASQVGVSRQTIVAVENGGYAPSVYLALSLSETLGLSVESLFGRESQARSEPEAWPAPPLRTHASASERAHLP